MFNWQDPRHKEEVNLTKEKKFIIFLFWENLLFILYTVYCGIQGNLTYKSASKFLAQNSGSDLYLLYMLTQLVFTVCASTGRNVI